MTTLKCGIVGCGVIAPTHIHAIEKLDFVDLVALCDQDSFQLKEQHKLAPNAIVYENYTEMLNVPELDVIVILTDHGSHHDLGIQAMQAGKHILVEKPVTANLVQLETLMIEYQKHPELICGGIFQHRFEGVNQVAKQIIDSGKIGTFLGINTEHRCYRSDEYYNDSFWRGTELEGGSVLINQSIHFLDLMLFFGGALDRIQSKTTNLMHQDSTLYEDTLSATLNYKNGSLGSFWASNASEGWYHRMSLIGSKATIILENGRASCIAEDQKLKTDILSDDKVGVDKMNNEFEKCIMQLPGQYSWEYKKFKRSVNKTIYNK